MAKPNKNGHPALASTLPTPQVALYMRVSTEDQADRETIDAQRDFLRQFASLYSLPVVEEYADDGVTGTLPLAHRPAGCRLLEDARIGRFGCVLVYRVDRLGRSLAALLDAHQALSPAGIAIRSATEPFDTSTPMGMFLFQLLGSLAELDKSSLLERMTLGRDRVAKQGHWTGGTIPLGYELDAEGYLVLSVRRIEALDMTEAELVRDVFQRVANGSTAIAECHRLNALGIGTARRYGRPGHATEVDIAAPWRPSRLTKVLNNPLYIGTHILKSKYGPVERPTPPLIAKATFDAVQAQLRRNRCLPKNTVHRLYLLRSLITCGLCGARYIGTPVSRQVGRMDYYYRCGGQTVSGRPESPGRCVAKILKAEWLEHLVWEDCRCFILDPGEALAEAQRQLQARLSQTASLAAEQQRLQRALAEKALEKERIMTLFRRGRASLHDTETHLDVIEREATDLRTTLSAMQAQRDLAEAFEQHYTAATTLLDQLRERLAAVEQQEDMAIKRQVVELLVAGIRVETTSTSRGKQATVTLTYTFAPERLVDSTMTRRSTAPPNLARQKLPPTSWRAMR
jgi:site-specific DNA recombinase